MSQISAPVARNDARMRLPREPYPGLRPFLDFEAALLFGRERQVREIIERLAATRFVAVLGGSGSGKSSLIHAGVTPSLRSHGIPGEGDLWLSMTCTPGTNVSRADTSQRKHTPVTRLARRFASLLRSRGSPAADQQRVQDIADAFRQSAGFARLLDAYADEFEVGVGPDPRQARVLFVLDQFEEIFHPTNQGVADAGLLVERVLDHFFNPHPRCYVVLTMRSEHLNDCARYLELPDAINKSSFLVRRLDGEELRQAIVGPAQRFLRLMARSGAASALPEQVRFEPAVIERLLRDVSAITHDPDHLPLLQHLLARLWQAALEREEMDVPVPSAIGQADLLRAVNASAPGDTRVLDPRLNTLRECVNNWPERIYQWHDAPQRAQFDALFRRLAFKDPNTGLYSQQRIDVDEGALLLGPGKTRDDLRALVAEGFLGSVDYLFWDDEDPTRVTLKVSHESFIRGWQRFRQLIDAESARLDQFVGLVRKCADWLDARRNDDDLLDTGDLRRARDTDFARRLADPVQRATWVRLLALDRDGERLARSVDELDEFLGMSERRQRERLRREHFVRRSSIAIAVLTTLLGLIPTALFTFFIQTPTMRRVELLFYASNLANATPVRVAQGSATDSAASLDALLRAAARVDSARSGEGPGITTLSRWLIERLGGLAIVGRQSDLLDSVIAQSEPVVNAKLRQQLGSALWRAGPDRPQDRMDAPAPQQRSCGYRAPDASDPLAAALAEPLQGLLFEAAADVATGAASGPRRAIFVPNAGRAGQASSALVIHTATWHPHKQYCVVGPSLLTLPAGLDTYALFDAGLRYMLYTALVGNGARVLVAQEVDWNWNAAGDVRAPRYLTLATVNDPAAIEAVTSAAGAQRVAIAPTWRQAAGRALQVGDQRWRLVSTRARPLAVDPRASGLLALNAAPPGSPCHSLAAGLPVPPPFVASGLDAGAQCLVVQRGVEGEGEAAAARAEVVAPRVELRVALYPRPDAAALGRLAENPPTPAALITPYARVAVDTGPPLQWALGMAGEHAGWLVASRPRRSGEGDVVFGAPLDTCALWRLGRELQGANPAPPAAGAAPAQPADGVCD